MATKWKNRTCGECVFHHDNKGSGEAVSPCRRFPMVPIALPVTQKRLVNGVIQDAMVWVVDSHYPSSRNSTIACGEFSPDEGQLIQ